MCWTYIFFFFQAEDGIRDLIVTGVQTCALPISVVKLLLVHNSYQQSGGEDQVFASELELLASHGHDVVRFTAHNDAVRQLSKLSLAFRTSWNPTTYREMRAVLQRERPQIVHVHNTLPLLSPAVYYAAGAARVPGVQTLHNYRLVCPGALLLREQR